MTSAQFKLDTFEGPLDLLLQLISKHKLNIYDIEITVLLEQYLAYIDKLEYEDYEDAADFLEMAARLIYIKTCSLLPQDDEAEELKKELQGRIIEYSLCKMAAQRLKQEYVGGEIFVRGPVKIPVDKTYTGVREPETLLQAYLGLSEKSRNSKPLKADLFEPIVSKKIVSVTSKIIYILKKLHLSGEFDMNRLYDGITDKSEQVATFLAVLELTKSGRIFLNDDNSKIFMNRTAKKRKIQSDFDRNDTEISVGNSGISEQNTEIATEKKEIVSLEDLPDETSSAEPVISYDKPSGKAKKNISLSERNAAVQCMAEISMKIDDINVDFEKSDKALSEGNIDMKFSKDENEGECLGESNEIFETPSEDAGENTDDRECCQNSDINDIPEEVLAELELLSKLSLEPLVTVFKPNYWLTARYGWGNSPVGDDKQGNCWKYGFTRKKF